MGEYSASVRLGAAMRACVAKLKPGEVRVHVTDEMAPGVVSLPHGWGHAPSARWHDMRGRTGVLHSGHAVFRVRPGHEALEVHDVAEASVTTIEAVGQSPEGKAIQTAWLDLEVVQCGYCQSGQIMTAAALLASNPTPTDSDIDLAMAGNICRCGTYLRIREAIKSAAGEA
mgnify:CR=1 FL=1